MSSGVQRPSVVEAGTPGWAGFRIIADNPTAVTGLGDVNGDGRDEIAVRDNDGAAVVFGRSDGQTVDTTHDGDWGFRIRGVPPMGRYGFVTGSGGAAEVNTSMLDAGDQNGDGRPDLAIADEAGVVVVDTPPNPAGADVDATDADADAFQLMRPAQSNQGIVTVSSAGDLNNDGRKDLVVAWDEQDPITARAVGVISPKSGMIIDLDTAAAAGAGWEVEAPGSYIENALSIGDQNGDGRRDVLLAAVDVDNGVLGGRRGLIGYAPPLGQHTIIRPPTPADGQEIDIYDGNVVDVGDQDGDGRSDLAFSDVVRQSSAGLEAQSVPAQTLGGRTFLTAGSIILGSLDDRNGDGRRELITVVSHPYQDENPPYEADWKLDVFDSAPTPQPIDVPLPSPFGDGLDFSGTFQTGSGDATDGRLSVELTASGSAPLILSAPDVTPSQAGKVNARLLVTQAAGRLVAGRSYEFRVLLENGWGLVGASQPQHFVYHPSGVATPQLPVAVPVRAVKTTVRHRSFVGTARGDRLVGTNGPDELLGRGGNDRLRGLGGDDRIDGGSGDDRIDGGAGDDRISGGPGSDRINGGRGQDTLRGGAGNDLLLARDDQRDVVDCGSGHHDSAIVDRRDRVRHCERVSRR